MSSNIHVVHKLGIYVGCVLYFYSDAQYNYYSNEMARCAVSYDWRLEILIHKFCILLHQVMQL